MKLTISKNNTAETFLVLTLVIITVFNNSKYATLLLDVAIVLFTLMFLLIISKSTVNESLPFLSYGIVWALTFFAGTLIQNNSPYVGNIVGVVYISILIIFACLFMGVKLEKIKIKIIFFTYILCNLLVSIDIIYNYMIGNYYVEQRASFLINGVYKDPNYVSSLIVPAAFLAFMMLKEGTYLFKKLFMIVALGVMASAIIITGSRAALVAVGISAAVYITLRLLSRKVKLIYKIGIIFLVMILVSVCSYLLMASEGSRLTDITGYKNDIRLVIWSDALFFWIRSPFIGNGVNAVSNYTVSCWYGRATHNCFLDLLADSGIIGILCFISILRLIIKRSKDKSLGIAFMAVCLVPQAFINGFYGFNFWFMICLIKLFVDYQEAGAKKIEVRVAY